MLDSLSGEVEKLGKDAWRPLLAYAAALHRRSIMAAPPPFPYPVEEIGPGYCYAPCFGHWDITHALFDTLPVEPEHARRQLLNLFAFQQPDGLMPGVVSIRGDHCRFSREISCPPVWPYTAEACWQRLGDDAFLATCLQALRAQIGWFNAARRAGDGGYYYVDIVRQACFESGIDDGIRFIERPPAVSAMVDASAHVYALLDFGARWAAHLGQDVAAFADARAALRAFIVTRLYDEARGFFGDSWSVAGAGGAVGAFEGMWPVVVGAAEPRQAARVIDEHLLCPKRFLTPHPLATVAVDDPRFELRCWRGPVWNSMTHWAALGCLRYDRPDAATRLLEAALDASAEQFRKTGTIWEFYHPFGEAPDTCARKPYTPYNAPCRNYLGHNPLIAMARLWTQTTTREATAAAE